MTAYDPQNPFAKILRGEFPCFKVYEDEHVLAFLDIMPRHNGEALLPPASRKEDVKVLENNAAKLAAALG